MAMALCAQVGEGPLVLKMTKSDLKTIPQGASTRSGPFSRDMGLLTWEVQRWDPGEVRWPQAEHHSPSRSPSSRCRGRMRGSQGADGEPLGWTRGPRRS